MKTLHARGRSPGREPDTVPATSIVLLLFEAADCLMALPASEVARLLAPPAQRMAMAASASDGIDLEEYFTGHQSNGPWLRWGRGTQSAWLRVRRIADVVPCPVSALAPMPALLRGARGAAAFWASGVRGDDVFLLLDPARLIDGLKS